MLTAHKFHKLNWYPPEILWSGYGKVHSDLEHKTLYSSHAYHEKQTDSINWSLR